MTELRPRGPLTHLAILASAGTGKTHALAHRYISLLGRGVEADRICALTFSRKAATEIFDSIVSYLVKASLSESDASRTGRHAELDGLTSREATRLLRNLVSRLHRVQIGTLDSFIVSVLRAFSAELGVPADFALMGSGSVDARRLTQEALGFLLAPSRTHAQHRDAFFEAFKKATYGREEKGFSATFFDVLESSLGLFRQYPDPMAWGEPGLIWGRTGWMDDPAAELGLALERIRSFPCPSDEVRENLLECLGEAAAFKPFNAWNSKVFECTIMKRLFEMMATLDDGGQFDYKKKTITLDPETGRAIRLILHHLVRQEIVRCLQQTQGLGAMLHQYHTQYDEIIRKRGAFTFNDAQYLLTPRNRNGAGSISRQAGDPDRLYIDYRLDAKLDHWLLDEFQDTSDLQWETLDNLASEIIQDAGGDRSFFLVGDVKQAIHGWRGGNAWLFGELLNRYRGGIELKTLSASFRSTKPVLDFVNRVFSNLDRLDLPAETVKRWHGLWANHVSEVKKPGFAAWVEPLPRGEGELEDEDVAHAAAGLIRELDPATKGLSIAVLLSTNADCTRMTDALRRELETHSIPVVNEGAAELADNPVAALMRSLLKAAGHPGDTLALKHLLMSPLRKQVQDAGDRLPLILQRQIQGGGFAGFFRYWATRLQEEIGPLDVFGAKRLHDLLAVAAESDASGNRDPDTLIALIDCHELREQTTGGAVRVMTIHQSKGLGFDAVIVPLLKNDSIRQVGQLDLTPGCTGDNTWILKMPRQIVSKADPVLNERLEKITADISFGNLCVLYVALTRARQGLYVITKYGRKKRNGNRSLSEGIVLARQLLNTDKPEAEEGTLFTAGGSSMRCLAQEGDPEWHKATPALKQAAPSPAPAGPLFPALEDRGTRLKRVEPSRGDTEIRQANWLFKSESRGVLEFGTLIHELLAQVEWTETADPEAILGSWSSSKVVDENVRRDAEAQFRRLLATPEVRSALARPAGTVDVWREMRFELVDGGAWISGAFDRVIVFRDKAGRATRATLMDFKSSRITEDREMEEKAADYRHQLDLYRRALSIILKIPESSVAVQILFTRPARVYNL